jgi:hypothetical protein
MFTSIYILVEVQVNDIHGNEEEPSVSDPVITHIRKASS